MLAAQLPRCITSQPQLSCDRTSIILFVGCLARLCSAAALARLLRCVLQGVMYQHEAAGAATSAQ
jgi:hypothetical protein